MNPAPPNPFSDLIVQDPRQREASVPGLNERPLLRLLQSFEKLIAGAAPRSQLPAGQALLVTSADPGYGKSHLIGRLFHALNGRATLVYVPPFQNPATPFVSLLLTTVRELHFPDRLAAGKVDPDEATQLDCLAHAVLAHGLADLAEGYSKRLSIDTPPETVRELRQNALAAFDRGRDPWAAWLVANWATLEPFLLDGMERRGVELAKPASWLRVFRAYAFSPDDAGLRRIALDWMLGEPLEPEEIARLGLRSGEATGEATPTEVNGLSRTRLVELCRLACYWRPFVFCFDQTEVYGHQAALARTFGMVVATLVHEAPGQLTMVTANQDPWSARIYPHLELADQQRFATPPLVLEGLNRDQAIALARLRLSSARTESGRVQVFLRGPWLDELFPGPLSQLAPRVFLQKCKERWSEQPVRDFTLAELYEQRCKALLHAPKRQLFEPDPLQWLVEVAARGLPGIEVETSEDRFFPVEWKTPERHCLFGFLSGNHWKQWLAAARACDERTRTAGALPVKCVFFRGPEQPPIPGPQWLVREQIAALRKKSLHILVLSAEEMTRLFATRDLYAQAAQGDIAYTTEEVIAFLHTALDPWWQKLAAPLPGSSPSTLTHPPALSAE